MLYLRCKPHFHSIESTLVGVAFASNWPLFVLEWLYLPVILSMFSFYM